MLARSMTAALYAAALAYAFALLLTRRALVYLSKLPLKLDNVVARHVERDVFPTVQAIRTSLALRLYDRRGR